MNRKTMYSLYSLGGLYLLYLAYQLFKSRNDLETTMTPFVRYLFIAVFVIAAAGMITYAVKNWKHADEQDEEKAQETKDDTKDLR